MSFVSYELLDIHCMVCTIRPVRGYQITQYLLIPVCSYFIIQTRTENSLKTD